VRSRAYFSKARPSTQRTDKRSGRHSQSGFHLPPPLCGSLRHVTGVLSRGGTHRSVQIAWRLPRILKAGLDAGEDDKPKGGALRILSGAAALTSSATSAVSASTPRMTQRYSIRFLCNAATTIQNGSHIPQVRIVTRRWAAWFVLWTIARAGTGGDWY